jgi:hypothetical protein
MLEVMRVGGIVKNVLSPMSHSNHIITLCSPVTSASPLLRLSAMHKQLYTAPAGGFVPYH